MFFVPSFPPWVNSANLFEYYQCSNMFPPTEILLSSNPCGTAFWWLNPCLYSVFSCILFPVCELSLGLCLHHASQAAAAVDPLVQWNSVTLVSWLFIWLGLLPPQCMFHSWGGWSKAHWSKWKNCCWLNYFTSALPGSTSFFHCPHILIHKCFKWQL